MTRQEALEQRALAAQQRVARTRTRLAQEQARHKQAAQKARQQRYWRLGQLADDAGLLVLDAPTLTRLFAHLGTLHAATDLVAALDALVQELACTAGTAADAHGGPDAGCAHPPDGVAAVRHK